MVLRIGIGERGGGEIKERHITPSSRSLNTAPGHEVQGIFNVRRGIDLIGIKHSLYGTDHSKRPSLKQA
jgi:hypothetical protein